MNSIKNIFGKFKFSRFPSLKSSVSRIFQKPFTFQHVKVFFTNFKSNLIIEFFIT